MNKLINNTPQPTKQICNKQTNNTPQLLKQDAKDKTHHDCFLKNNVLYNPCTEWQCLKPKP